MEGKIDKSVDLISDLPITILHRIMSFLHIRCAVRTSVLSKQWNSIQKSFPILFFSLRIPIESEHVKELQGEYLDFVDKSLQNFAQNKLAIKKMVIYLPDVYRDWVPMINTWLPLALHNGVSDLIFNANVHKDIVYPLLETTFVVNSSLLAGSSRFSRLQKLTLSLVCLSENTIGDIIRNCPNLRDLVLRFICGVKTIDICKPNKLENLTINVSRFGCVESISVDALALNRFSLVWNELVPRSCAVDLTSCYNLRGLNLAGVIITDALYHLLFSRFPLLEDLCFSMCHFQPRIVISLQWLKYFQLLYCTGLGVIEIDAPVFSEFDFTPGEENLPSFVSTRVIPGSMHLRYDMHYLHREVGNFWFLKIREFLSVPFKGISFYPISEDPEEDFDSLSFNLDELIRDGEDGIPPLAEVDCLDLTEFEITGSSDWVTFINGLLWSCLPKTVFMTVTADSNDEDNCIKIFCRILMQSKCELCCNLAQCKCWRRRLKAMKLETTRGISLDIEKSISGFDRGLFRHTLDGSDLDVRFSLSWE